MSLGSPAPPKLRLGVVAGPFLLFLLHAALFGAWIVDDAGISFAYARNLAHGYGLVSQPGQPPVEGFSNFLWVLGLTPTFWLRLFHPVWTPKVLAAALTFGTFALLDRALFTLGGGRRWVSLAALLFLAVNSGFVIWSVSGLENPLYAFLLTALFALVVEERRRLEAGEDPGARPGVWAGVMAWALALTRPDGILFAVLYPLFWAISRRRRPSRRALAAYAAAFGGLFAAFLAFRYAYFGDLVPNTFHAKGGPGLATLRELLLLTGEPAHQLADLAASVAGPLGLPALGIVALLGAFLAGRGRFSFALAEPALFTAAAAAAFLLLPRDWMEEYRFATAFYPVFYAGVALLAREVGELLAPAERRQAGLAAGGLALVLALALFGPRSLLFAAAPTVPFAEVEEAFGHTYNRFAEKLGVAGTGSFLLPDLGGTLWTSNLRVVDLVGLCDPVISRTLKTDRPAFHDYVFERVKPTFIHVHEAWTLAAGLDTDPRFRRDYLPLIAYTDPVLYKALGVRFLSGDFIRRDVAEAHPQALAEIRAELTGRYQRRFGGGAHAPAPERREGS